MLQCWNLLGIVFISWPLIVFGDFPDSSLVASFEDEIAVSEQNICKDDALTLSYVDTLNIYRESIISSSLKCLVVTGLKIEIHEGAFENVPNLMYLDLQAKDINFMSLFASSNISNLKILKASASNWYINEDIRIQGKYPEVRYLNLKNGNIKYISSEWNNSFPKLTHLNLSENKIEYFMISFHNTLTYLDLRKNRISEFSFQELNKLSFLLLDDNAIQSLKKNDLIGLQRLTNFSITKNELTSIDFDVFEDMINLRYLNISHNRLSTLQLYVNQNSKLETLVLDRNLIKSFAVTRSVNITMLSLNCNSIEHLTVDYFYHMPELRQLFLSRNEIINVYVDTFINQKQLEELDLSYNKLTYLPTNWTQSMKKLRYLNLSNNGFTFLESIDVFNLPVKQLYFEGNPLAYINANTFQMLRNITIYLNIGSKSPVNDPPFCLE